MLARTIRPGAGPRTRLAARAVSAHPFAAPARSAATDAATPPAPPIEQRPEKPRHQHHTPLARPPTDRGGRPRWERARQGRPPPALPEYIPGTEIRVVRTVAEMRDLRYTFSSGGVGLVPTMGALHDGHASLVRAAAAETRHVVVSVYVNPAQFGVREDLDSYPKTWEADCRALAELDAELARPRAPADAPGDAPGDRGGRIVAVFAPTTAEMYPSGFPGQEVDSRGSFVTITPESSVLEGASRPTFFRGVATVVMKLFNVVRPHRAYFGQKDAQQAVVLRKMAKDFLLPVRLRVRPIAREPDGLARSSRNVYLGARRRAVAPVLFRALRAGTAVRKTGEASRGAVLGAVRAVLDGELERQRALPPRERALFEVDYVSMASAEDMQEVDEADPRGTIVSLAVRFPPVEEPQEGEDLGHNGGPPVRLIDNWRMAAFDVRTKTRRETREKLETQ